MVLGVNLYSFGHFEPSSKWRRNASMKALLGTLRKEVVVGIACWEHKSHLYKDIVLSKSTYGTKIWGGDMKKSHWKAFEKILMMSQVKVHSSTICHIMLAKFG